MSEIETTEILNTKNVNWFHILQRRCYIEHYGVFYIT